MVDWLLSRSISGSEEGGSEEAVVSKLRKLSPTTAGRLSGAFDISAATSRRLSLFESSVKCGDEES